MLVFFRVCVGRRLGLWGGIFRRAFFVSGVGVVRVGGGIGRQGAAQCLAY